ncbi:MAG: DNA topoisomerase III [Peptococcaceae bacterium BRH_c8a]|nr:MAG: DNA topoisomerase III [Peptococcaceae bacterium BRH_c8a]
MDSEKKLVITEKPSVARDLAGILGRFNRKDGYLENNEYVITWAIGHLVELAAPEDYNPQLKKWSFNTLPILPEEFKLKANPGTKKQFKVVKELLNRPDIGQLICATDAGREGELIFRYIYHLSGSKKPFVRLWLSETTPAAVKKGFENLRPGIEFDRLGYAAQARSQSDWLIGINATRSFTVKHNDLLSVGRVQTPTLALIVNREQEINNFVTAPYWELYAKFTKNNGETYTGRWFKGEQNRFADPLAARALQDKVDGQPAAVQQVEEKDITELPPLLFNLNDLQKEANKKYGLAAARTLELAQSLYETRKLLTYPRTDSRHITKELAKTIPGRLNALSSATEYMPYTATAMAAGTPGKRYVDDSKVSDHTALIPTDINPVLDNLPTDERKIFDLVVRRFLAIFFPPARYKKTSVTTEATGETFLTVGRVELDKGWKTVYTLLENEPGEEDGTGVIPKLGQGESVQTTKTEIREKKAKPPKRYTEASLLAVMEGAGRLLDDKELKEAMKGHGLGTPATRAAIIERLIKVGYIERHKKNLVPTAKGEKLINLVPEIIKNPDLTGKWEKTLADIEAGAANPEEFMAGIRKLTTEIVELARNQIARQQQSTKESLGKCPLCGKDVIEGNKGYGCSGYKEGCKFVIWIKIAGKKLSLVQAKTLLEKGKTGIIKGFKSKKGNKFDAILQLKDGKVEFLFDSETEKQPHGKCPLCGQDVIESAKGYGCSGYKAGCKFVIWKEICGKKITVNEVQDLLQKGKTPLIKDFKSKTGKNFDAILVLQNGKVGFEF